MSSSVQGVVPSDASPAASPRRNHFSRFRRSLSYFSVTSSSNLMPVTAEHLTTKLTPFERFVKLCRRNKDGSIEFPPVHWSEAPEDPHEDLSEQPGTDRHGDDHHIAPSIEQFSVCSFPLESTASLLDGTAHSADASCAVPTESGMDEGPPPEPLSLARRIQAMISGLSSPSSGAQATSSDPSTSESMSDTKPALSSFLSDSRLVSFLSSPSVMNGSAAKSRQSVWALLDRMRSTTTATFPRGAQEDSWKGKSRQADESFEELLRDDDSSIMLYGPLVPDDSSEVEVARSEIISLDEDTSTIGEGQTEGTETPDRLAGIWPFSARGTGEEKPAPTKVSIEKKVWVPSKTRISLEIRWWGYRMCALSRFGLPSSLIVFLGQILAAPVLAVLDNQRIEATKRAALLTTALKWLLDHIPMAAVPLQVRPALPLLRTVVPYLGYMGAFVAWSWDAIKAFDKGNGVILTATWLLTFALIPGTWEDHRFPDADDHAPSTIEARS